MGKNKHNDNKRYRKIIIAKINNINREKRIKIKLQRDNITQHASNRES